MLPLVTFPICNVYLPKRLKLLAPNVPTHPAIGMPANDVTRAVPDAPAPINPHRKKKKKKAFETGFEEQ